MFEGPLHVGAEHPHLAWVLIPSLVAFVAGLLIGNANRLFDAVGEPDAPVEE